MLIGVANTVTIRVMVGPTLPAGSDGDPNYSNNYTVSTNATINTSIANSVYLYTYTADPDNAGNPGEIINRTIRIMNSSVLSYIPPLELESYLKTSLISTLQLYVNKTDIFENASFIETFQINNSTYAGISSPDHGVLYIVNITDIKSPNLLSSIGHPESNAPNVRRFRMTYAG